MKHYLYDTLKEDVKSITHAPIKHTNTDSKNTANKFQDSMDVLMKIIKKYEISDIYCEQPFLKNDIILFDH